MKRILCILLIFGFAQNAFGQGINFQGVARSANGVILASQKISLKLSIITGTATTSPDYVETRSVSTNAQGIFSIVVGDTGAISTIGTYASISWKTSTKFLKVEMDPNNGTSFISMGTTPLQYVPFSYYSNGVDAANVAGVLPVKSGGTGVATISDLKVALVLDKVNNTSDLDKPISTLTQTALGTKLSTTGNAATATTAGNITATANTTLTSLSSLATVGTITSGVWSGTAVAVAKGGTGLTAAGTNGQVLTSTGSGTLTWTTPATSSSNNSNELTGIIIFGKNISGVNEVWKSNFDGSSQSKINIAGLPANYEIPSDSYRISADGKTIFFLLYTPTGGQHIYKCNIDGSGLSKIINNVDEIASVSGFYSPNTTHYVGESFGGGIIFSLYKGSDGLEHGLIVALTEQANTKWQNTGALVNATRSEDGGFNTALMTNSPAANYITSLGAGWYLPSIDELTLLYNNRYNVQKALRAGGYTLLSHTVYAYWSSTEYDKTYAFALNGTGGSASSGEDKTNLFTVRGVRAF